MYCKLKRTLLEGGTTNRIRSAFYLESGAEYDLSGCEIYFTLTDYVNLMSAPVIPRAKATIDANDPHIAEIVLSPADTVDLYGKFRWRFTVHSPTGGIDAITGDLFINICTDKEAAL